MTFPSLLGNNTTFALSSKHSFRNTRSPAPYNHWNAKIGMDNISFHHQLGPASQSRKHNPADFSHHCVALEGGPGWGRPRRVRRGQYSLDSVALCFMTTQLVELFPTYVSHEVLLRTLWRFLVGTFALAVSSTQAETYLIWDGKWDSFLSPWSPGVMPPAALLPASLYWGLCTLQLVLWTGF